MKRYNPTDYGPEPYVIHINRASMQNPNYRTALWTGNYLQATLMSITDEIGLEIHPDTDQFIKIEEGFGLAMMGKNKDNLNYQVRVGAGCAIFLPAGIWHNVVNKGSRPLKLYTIYAPPHHPHGTVQKTITEAQESENHY